MRSFTSDGRICDADPALTKQSISGRSHDPATRETPSRPPDQTSSVNVVAGTSVPLLLPYSTDSMIVVWARRRTIELARREQGTGRRCCGASQPANGTGARRLVPDANARFGGKCRPAYAAPVRARAPPTNPSNPSGRRRLHPVAQRAGRRTVHALEASCSTDPSSTPENATKFA
jgi:hypothetical protein